MKEAKSDTLDSCLARFASLWMLTLILVVWVGVSGLFLRRSLPVSSLALVRDLDITGLSLVPSGQILRNPEIRHPCVDMRMVPGLPPLNIESATLLLHLE